MAKKVLVLGSGPAVIGQGGEYDHSGTMVLMGLREAGVEAVLLDSNAVTVVGDPALSARTYLEPVTAQTAEWIIEREKPDALLAMVGGHSALAIALQLSRSGVLKRHGVTLLGVSPETLSLCADRIAFGEFVRSKGMQAPGHALAITRDEVRTLASKLGLPLLARGPDAHESGGARFVHEPEELDEVPLPVVLSQFLEHAVQADVDLVADALGNTYVGGVMEHIEEAGVHAGDAACALPPYSLGPDVTEKLKDQATELARALGVVGLCNVRFAVQGRSVTVLELNPRTSRTVPFVTRATQVPLAKIAAQCVAGRTLPELGYVREAPLKVVAIREAVFPFARSAARDVLLGTQMQSTGSVVGISDTHATAYAKAQLAAGMKFPEPGQAVFISVRDEDKPAMVDLARRLRALGHDVLTTEGTCRYLTQKRIPTEQLVRVAHGSPNAVDLLRSGRIGMVINTPSDRPSALDSAKVRREAVILGVSYFTTANAARMAVEALEALRSGKVTFMAVQDGGAVRS